MSLDSSSYTARHLSVLEGLDAVRKRPGMYIGSTDSRGLMHCLWEIIDNGVDEALSGYANKIGITLHKDGSVEVADNGRGIPVDIEPKSGLSGVELVFTKLHAGGKFGGSSYAASGGLHGVGASVVNALSTRLDVEVDRDGQTHQMNFRRGEPGVFVDKEGLFAPEANFTAFVSGSKVKLLKKVAPGITGTRVRYWPDTQVFGKTIVYDYDDLLARARQTAFLVPGLEVVVSDRRRIVGSLGEHVDYEEKFHYSGGIVQFADFLAEDPPITDTWYLEGSDSFEETVPVLNESGQLVSTEVSRKCEVGVALRWGIAYKTNVRSFVNIISTFKGGTHLNGFEQALLKTFRKVVAANARKLKVGNDKLEKDDIFAGLTAVITVRLAEPQFEGQTKEILGTAAVRGVVSKIVEQQLYAKLVSTSRNDKAQVTLLLEKVVAEMKSRISARVHKETQRRKNALETSSLPAKLADCRTSDLESSELFIVEGDSALGTAKLARSSDYQALLPIRGKILNVQKASVGDMLSNSECASIIQVIGAGSGRSFQLDLARYGKVIIMTDADVDGAHIRTLLLTLFFRYMRPLIDAGRVYAAVPPLHRVEVVNAGSKKNELIYTYSEAQLQEVLAKLEKNNKKYKQPIQRYKGLGEMDADQLAETTMDASLRTLRRIQVSDAISAEKVFDLLMGSNVAPRKDFIVTGVDVLDKDRIDV